MAKTRYGLRDASSGERALRGGATVLAALGFLDAVYMLAYDEGLIDTIACPFFGQGCARVGRSPHARHFGVPNAAVGAVGYAAIAVLVLWEGGRPASHRRWKPGGFLAAASAAVAASAFLTWEQATRVRAWCFWCLSSAAINVALFAVAVAEVRRARHNRRRRH